MKTRTVKIGNVSIGGSRPLVMIGGPCVIESRRHCVGLAGKLVEAARTQEASFIFKASYDKANRTSIHSFRGPGLEEGLDVLREVKERHGVPVLTDVHEVRDVAAVAEVADIIQLPAFLSRQTDLIVELGHTGKPINIKKGQFLAPWDVKHVIAKFESTGNRRLVVTERGSTFGYNNLVADMRSLVWLRELGYPVVFDATHSVQAPGGEGDQSGGNGHLAPFLARAAVAVGCDGLFCETHESPSRARSDGANAIPLTQLKKLWSTVTMIDTIVRR